MRGNSGNKKEIIIYKYNHWIHADNHSLELLRNINKNFLPFSCNFQILYVALQKHLKCVSYGTAFMQIYELTEVTLNKKVRLLCHLIIFLYFCRHETKHYHTSLSHPGYTLQMLGEHPVPIIHRLRVDSR